MKMGGKKPPIKTKHITTKPIMTKQEITVNMNRDFKGIWIPREIWLKDEISPEEKFLWAEIHSLFDPERGGCYASNEYLMKFMRVQERPLQRMLANLRKCGMIEQVSFDGRVRVIKAVLPATKTEVTNLSPLGCQKCHPSDDKNVTPLIYRDTRLDNSLKVLAENAQCANAPAIAREDFSASLPASPIHPAAAPAARVKPAKAARPPSDFSPTVKDIAEEMINTLTSIEPTYAPPRNTGAILKTIDIMINHEKKSHVEILKLFRHFANDSFWSSKFMVKNPAEYLRKKYAALKTILKNSGNSKAVKPQPQIEDATYDESKIDPSLLRALQERGHKYE